MWGQADNPVGRRWRELCRKREALGVKRQQLHGACRLPPPLLHLVIFLLFLIHWISTRLICSMLKSDINAYTHEAYEGDLRNLT